MTAATEVAEGRAPGALMWAGITFAAGKGATLVATLVLARILVPADFGLFAVGLLVINYLDRVKDIGVGSSLVYSRESWTRLAGTALPISVGTAFLLGAGAFLGAPLVAAFFEDPRAGEILRALSVVLLISGLGVVPESRLRRELDFRRRAVPELTAAVLKGVLSVVLALTGFGVWALVWGQLAGTIVQTTLYWLLCRWRPRVTWHREDARLLLRYGIPSALVAVLAVVIENLDYLIIGRRLDATELGYYVLAYRIPEITIIAVCVVAGQVFFPMFSRMQDDIPGIREAYLRVAHHVALITVPVGLGIAVAAPEIVFTLYGDRWEPAVPVVRLLGLFGVVYSLSFHAGEIYKATGRPGILNWLGLTEILVMAPALWFAAAEGIVAAALAMVLAYLVLTALKIVVVQRILDIRGLALVRRFVPALLASTLMAGTVLLVSAVLPVSADLVRLLVLVLVGVAAYAVALRIFAPEALRELVSRFNRMRQERSTPKTGAA
jgi:lipopolysaccharide exporter